MLLDSIDKAIGGTPLIELSRLACANGLRARLFAKPEFMNPTGSIKDRAALAIIEDAEERGLLKPGGVIVEATSGNTGIGLASIAAARGYRAIIIMPDTMSAERIALMKAYGAEVVLSDGAKGMAGSLAKLAEVKAENPDAFEAGQFVNPANARAHYATTGPEIRADLEEAGAGPVDVFVAGVGTGGTLTGAGRFLKESYPEVEIVAVEPVDSPLLSEGRAGAHKLQGIGANFVPEILDRALIDRIETVSTEEAYGCVRELGRLEGMMVGITSGAAIAAAERLALSEGYTGKNIVAVLPDSGDRYLTTGVFGG